MNQSIKYRKTVKGLLKTRVDDPIKAEKLLYKHAQEIQESTQGDLSKIYHKLAFERIGELDSIPREKRMEHLTSKQVLWDSSIYDEYRKQEKRRREFQVLSSTGGVKSGDIKCKKCKKKTVTYYQLQTRSCDEGSTVFYTCVSCGTRWKE